MLTRNEHRLFYANGLDIQRFLNEDIPNTDITSESIFGKADVATAAFVAKESGIIAGVDVIQATYEAVAKNSRSNADSIHIDLRVSDGDVVKNGDIIAKVQAPAIWLLKAERVILNLMQRMSGIANATFAAVERLGDPSIALLDTRKTAPGLRCFDKAAVRIGGGQNHRFSLSDMVMIKDNHIDFAGGIAGAVQKVRQNVPSSIDIEVETRNLADVAEAVRAEVDIIMLDNFALADIPLALALIPPSIKTEISGGITFENLPQYRGCGVDYISLGYLTHSIKAFDISFKV